MPRVGRVGFRLDLRYPLDGKLWGSYVPCTVELFPKSGLSCGEPPP